MYNQMQKTIESQYQERSPEYKSRIIKWNSEPSINRVDKPSNIARARKLGYKAKEGVIVVRVMVKGGMRKRKHAAGGRKPSKSGRYFTQEKSLQSIAEERAARKFINCEVLNSYFVGDAGSKKFFEIILLNRDSSQIRADRDYIGVISRRGRAFRGLTSSGKKHRGIERKRFGSHKLRPGKSAFKRTK